MKLTEKFEKELNKFFVWANNKLVVKHKETHETIEWKLDMVTYAEPARNKLEMFLLEVMRVYQIEANDKVCNDNREIATQYKMDKPKKPRKQKELENEIHQPEPLYQTIEKLSNLNIEIEKSDASIQTDYVKIVENIKMNYEINLEDILCQVI